MCDDFDLLGNVLGDFAAAADDDFARIGMADVFRRGAAQNALGQRGDDLAAVDFRLNGDTVLGAAILLRDDAIVRHVDETARQIARIRRLQRGIGQTLAGAVRWN